MVFDSMSAVLDAPEPDTSSPGGGNRTPTAVAVAAVAGCDLELTNGRKVIDAAVAAVLAEFPEGGLVDSWQVAAEMLKRRRAAGDNDACATQTRNYVQYLFRETAAHVCRHAEERHYRVHPEELCSAACDTKFAHTPGRARRDVCTSCFVELTTSGECAMGC